LGHKDGGTEIKARPKIAPARRTDRIDLKLPNGHRQKKGTIKRQQENKEGKAFEP
jgi:hypothetical protein